MGERSLRRLLIIGANSVIIKRHVHAAAKPGTWLGGMLTRKPPMLVRVALANKMARIVWALMARVGLPSDRRAQVASGGEGKEQWRNSVNGIGRTSAQQSALEHAALIWTRPSNTLRACGMCDAAS